MQTWVLLGLAGLHAALGTAESKGLQQERLKAVQYWQGQACPGEVWESWGQVAAHAWGQHVQACRLQVYAAVQQ